MNVFFKTLAKMFFIICPGYPPVPFEQKSDIDFTSMLPQSNSFCVFTESIPQGHYATVFVRLDTTWEQLGVLTPTKLSAFFKAKGLSIQEIGIHIEVGIPPQIMVSTNTSLGLTSHIAKKLMTHLENYVLSFTSSNMIPITVFQNWMASVEQKLSNDSHFLD